MGTLLLARTEPEFSRKQKVSYRTATPVARLLAVTVLATVVHGYHLGVDDAEIYIPAIKRAADPALYPFGSEFFETHAHLSLFSQLVGWTARLIHLSPDWAIFLWHIGSVFALLFATWKLASLCFNTPSARWGAVLSIAAALSVPVAGTALILMDPYLTARSLSTPATILAIAAYVSGRPLQSAMLLLFTALIHPQMSIFCGAVIACIIVDERMAAIDEQDAIAKLSYTFGFAFLFDRTPAYGAAREALLSRDYFFLSNWRWYEWIGVFAPLALLVVFARFYPRGGTPTFRCLARTLVPYGLTFTAAGLLLSSSPHFENLTRLQPMRAFHLLYIIMFLLLGGILGEYLLKAQVWRWCAFFVPVAGLMMVVQCYSFPNSAHVEWPGDKGNEWTSAFFWIRQNTPKDAVFALDPNYMLAPGDDLHGFRALAERSALADNVKDSGAVSLFPQLADQWKKQVTAQTGLNHFRIADLLQLARAYPVTWLVSSEPTANLICPYHNREISICRMDRDSLRLAAIRASAQAVPLP